MLYSCKLIHLIGNYSVFFKIVCCKQCYGRHPCTYYLVHSASLSPESMHNMKFLGEGDLPDITILSSKVDLIIYNFTSRKKFLFSCAHCTNAWYVDFLNCPHLLVFLIFILSLFLYHRIQVVCSRMKIFGFGPVFW